jgi:hypothetical protein
MNEQWINEMRQKMTDYQWPVPEVSWDEIDQAVEANKARKVRLFWLRRMAAAAVLLLVWGIGVSCITMLSRCSPRRHLSAISRRTRIMGTGRVIWPVASIMDLSQ